MRRADSTLEHDPVTRSVARLTGIAFVVAGLPKFVFFGFETDQFERFGLPAAGVLVIITGVVEIAGGIALARRTFVLPALAVLIPTMLVAIGSSGIKEGDVIPSLTVAPALLAALAFLAWRAVRPRAAPADRPRPSR